MARPPDRMYRPTDIAFGGAGIVFVVDQRNHRVSKWTYTQPSYTFTLDLGKVTSVVVNNGGTGYVVADPIIFSAPDLDIPNPVTATGEVGTETAGVIDTIVVTNSGNGYSVAPTIDATGSGNGDAVLTAVISGPWGSNGDGTSGEGAPIGDGGPTDNGLYNPTGIAFDATNSRLYVTDTLHHRVRVINSATGAFVSSFGTSGNDTANFHRPAGIAINNLDTTLVIADERNRRAVKYDVNGGAPNSPEVLADPSATTGLSFQRPYGVVFDISASEFAVCDIQRSVISNYNVAGTFQVQYGTPGAGTGLFYPGSGEGQYGGTASTAFANTRNNRTNGMTNSAILIATGLTPGTADSQLYWPESVSAFVDTVNYVLIANTQNNRIETFSSTAAALTAESPFNFGSP